MHTKGLKLLLIVIIALSVAACNQQSAPGEAPPSKGAEPASEPSTSYEELYRDTVFLGDSITEGLTFHDILSEERVIAGAGKTAEFTLMEDDVDNLVAREPERVFIHLGSTDILWPTDDPQTHSLTHYGELIDRIRVPLPQTKIVLLSVAPVTADAEEAEPRYRNIDAYNEGLQKLAADKQIGFVDLTPLVTQYANLYDTDGIHFQAAFYPKLLEYLKDA
ncbi:GDSL-type esterase/lipase family protein [Paenibacillus sp. 1P07SE]|uniref:GDSL-type esterase/lipase family protein n=1 Tax=Paenibacillus sp. 1P07SE TaxID=3132209 RepID=UPI0039A46DE4